MTKVFAVLIGSLALATANWQDDWFLTVRTSKGFVQGTLGRSCRSGAMFGAFRGIPYAEPPVGSLRFRAPVPRSSWDGIWNANYQRASCLQLKDDKVLEGSSEDCLYLNVYTPNMRYLQHSSPELKPVMVFIHPGAFTTGDSGEELYSPDFFMNRDVVLVTFNYRLGALGFLSLQNEDVPGNAGLKDQNMVLLWVQENIRQFGGDPSRVTLFGQSAGAASVNYHILSSLSAGLFQYAIMESGAAIAPWAFTPPEQALKIGTSLIKLLGCRRRTPEETLKCLQEVPAERIGKRQDKTIGLQELLALGVIAFLPTTEPQHPGAFLTEHPYDLMESGNFTKVPTIIGVTGEEGLFLIPGIKKIDHYDILLSALSLDLSRFVPQDFNVRPFTKSAFFAHKEISKFYFGYQRLSKDTLLTLGDLATDTMFTLPIQITAVFLAENWVPVYNYLFTYDGGYNIMKVGVLKSDMKGAFHGDDLGYLFYSPMMHNCNPNATYTEDERMIHKMTGMWTNFAKTGNPNLVKGPYAPTNWKTFTKWERNYLDLGRQLVPSDSLKLPKILFWENLLTKLTEMGTSGSGNLESGMWKDLQ